MNDSYFTNPLIFLVQVIIGGYGLVVLLRFLLQYFRADFHNPISQFIVRITSPVLKPMRRFIPGIGGMDISSLILAWLLKALEFGLIVLMAGLGSHFLAALLWAIPELIGLTINIFLIAIFIQVILSWFGPSGYNPALNLLYALTEPLLEPARRFLPIISGLDLSPMVVMIILVLLKMLLLPPIQSLVGSPML